MLLIFRTHFLNRMDFPLNVLPFALHGAKHSAHDASQRCILVERLIVSVGVIRNHIKEMLNLFVLLCDPFQPL